MSRTPKASEQKAQARTAVRFASTEASDAAMMRYLARTGGWTGRERLRMLWYRLRLVVQEINYASSRLNNLRTSTTHHSGVVR
jgi:hypothetical protein